MLSDSFSGQEFLGSQELDYTIVTVGRQWETFKLLGPCPYMFGLAHKV